MAGQQGAHNMLVVRPPPPNNHPWTEGEHPLDIYYFGDVEIAKNYRRVSQATKQPNCPLMHTVLELWRDFKPWQK